MISKSVCFTQKVHRYFFPFLKHNRTGPKISTGPFFIYFTGVCSSLYFTANLTKTNEGVTVHGNSFRLLTIISFIMV